MSFEFAGNDDMFRVADGLQAVQYCPIDDPTGVDVEKALRRDVRSRVSSRNASGITEHDVFWYLPQEVVITIPKVGATIIDATGTHWLVIDIDESRQNGYWRCVARDMAARFALDQLVDVDRAELAHEDDGTQSVEWTSLRAGLKAVWGQVDASVETDRIALETELRAVLYLEERLLLDHRCRIKDETEKYYRVITCQLPERIGELTRLVVEPYGE